MTIHGFQKMTLLDFPGRVACTVFTAGCNFRCPFCHNARLVNAIDNADSCDEDAILSFLKKRRGLLDGVAVTGGEPMLQPDLPDFLRRVRELGFSVKLDTNGSFPDRLAAVIEEGLVDYVAMDIKNSPAKYALTAGCAEALLPAVRESAAILMRGRVPFEFRTTVMKELHTPEDMAAIGAWIAGEEPYFIQPFADSGELVGRAAGKMTSEQTFTTPGADRLACLLNAVRPFVPNAQLRGV